jgi:RNA 3'-phosphate cyclase
MIQLDGSYVEGGGALIRTALALSTLTGKPFEVTNIRSGRPNPGLKAQHLTAIQALKQICDAKTNEIKLGSTELRFIPNKVKNSIYEFDIGTAGSISLLLQALILPCMFAPGKVTIKIKGGTCGKWQASIYYIQNLLIPQIQRFVEKIELKFFKHGYFPKGGGEVHLIINPKFNLENSELNLLLEEIKIKTAKILLINQGELEQIRGIINLSLELQDKEVAERIKISAESSLKKYEVPVNIRTEYTNTLSIGGEIVLWAIFSNNGKVDYDNPVILGSDALIEKGKKSADVSREVTTKLDKEISSNAAIDHYLTDQLIQFMALLPGSNINSSKISNHTKTNIYVVEKFLNVGFKVDGDSILVEEL